MTAIKSILIHADRLYLISFFPLKKILWRAVKNFTKGTWDGVSKCTCMGTLSVCNAAPYVYNCSVVGMYIIDARKEVILLWHDRHHSTNMKVSKIC